MSLEGKVAFVTGASGGIGAAVARSLVAAGVKVGLASRRGDDLGLGDAAYGLACDVSDHEEVDASVAATVERFGQLDIVVANAGVGAYGPFLELKPEHLEEMIDVNLKGTLYTVRAALPHLLQQRRRGHRHARLRGRPARASVRGRLLRLEVRPGRLHARARPRAPRAGRPLHERLPGRRRDRVRARGRPRPEAGGLPGMMTAEDVAEIVMFVITRPRNHRILETAIRPMTETSWG